jgi:hypothetical protein
MSSGVGVKMHVFRLAEYGTFVHNANSRFID